MKKLLYIGNNLKTPESLPTGISTLSKKLVNEGFEVITGSSKKNKGFRLAHMLFLVKKHAKTTDFVLIDTYSTWNFWYAYSVAVLCQKLSLKYIPVLHGGNLPFRLKNNPKACKQIFNAAYINVTPSLYNQEAFAKAGFLKLKYIPNSLELSRYPFKKRREIAPKLLWVRAFAEIYNPLMALKVLELLLQKHPEASLCMVGPKKDGSWEKCQQYAKKKKLPVSFCGKLKKEDWIILSEDYDVFLNTTNVDNAPVSVTEAMALGLPVISTNVGGIPFLIEDGKEGVLVNPHQPGKMAEAVDFLIQNPGKAACCSALARKKAENLDWERVKEKWLEILS